jgi:hypothetical protein
MKLGGAKHLGLRRLDAALLLLARLFQSGVEPPQSKALRAFAKTVASQMLMRICG